METQRSTRSRITWHEPVERHADESVRRALAAWDAAEAVTDRDRPSAVLPATTDSPTLPRLRAARRAWRQRRHPEARTAYLSG